MMNKLKTKLFYKVLFLVFFIQFFGCKNDGIVINKCVCTKGVDRYRKETISTKVGDVNGDKIPDLSYWIMYFDDEDDNIEVDGEHVIKLYFSSGVSCIDFYNTVGISVYPVIDVNGDGVNEILVSSHIQGEGMWCNLFLLSNIDGKWIQLAKTDAMPLDENDVVTRLVKEGGDFYLIGEKSHTQVDDGGFVKYKIKI